MIDIAPLSRIDSFAYRHRLAEVMAHPVLTGPETLTIAEACDRMYQAGTSSLVVADADGRAIGIVTERDLLRIVSQHRAAALDLLVAEVMASPVQTVPGDAFLFVALGRMTRLGLRHLVVADSAKRPIGMITGRALLKIRSSDALVIGDGIQAAETPADMAKVRQSLPKLAADLLAEGVSARTIAAVVSSVLRDLTARCTELAEAAMIADGWGPAPARWAMLVLGSGGRGESLLSFDQDNAIVHMGGPGDDLWFAEIGKRVADQLNAAGIPYCEGEVMARNPQWRRSLEDWKSEIRNWVYQPANQTVMNTDIFFDFQPVHGDYDLAEQLRIYAIETASTSSFFLQYLSYNVSKMEVPIGIFGEFITTHGKLNAKKFGLLPLVSAARARAVRAHITATSTGERYAALHAQGLMHEDDLRGLLDTHELIMRVMLEQQLVDLQNGVAPSARIEPRKLPRPTQAQLKNAFRRIRVLKTLVGGPLPS